MIRWERQEDGGWQGFSGELLVATVTKDESAKGEQWGELLVATVTKDESAEGEQWLWSITALKRPKGWRKGAGHRTSWIDDRRAAEEYWAKWLEQAALRAEVVQLASRSLAKERKARPRKPSPMRGAMPTPTDPGLWPGPLTNVRCFARPKPHSGAFEILAAGRFIVPSFPESCDKFHSRTRLQR